MTDGRTQKHVRIIDPRSKRQAIVAARAVNEARVILAGTAFGATTEDIDDRLRKLEMALWGWS